MTPDDVVARARELEGREVLLTVRGTVMVGQGGVALARDNGLWTTLTQSGGGASPSLVSIQPAPMRIEPMRIEPGELYADGRGVVYVGAGVGMLQAVNGEKRGAVVDQATLKGLRRVKVVDA